RPASGGSAGDRPAWPLRDRPWRDAVATERPPRVACLGDRRTWLLPPGAGEQPGLVSAPIEGQAHFIDLTSFEHESADGLAIAGSFGLPPGGLFGVASLAHRVVLQLDEQS